MPPKKPVSKAPQKKTSKPKQNIKRSQEKVVEDKRQSLLDKKRDSDASEHSLESEDVADIIESKSVDIMDRFAQKKDLILEQAIADAGLEILSFSEEGEEEEEEEEEESESDQPFGIMAQPSKFIKCDGVSEVEEEEDSDLLPIEQIEEDDNFFKKFGIVPDVDQLSEEESIKEEVKEERKPLTTAADRGEFVNPVTGQIILPPKDDLQIVERVSEAEPVQPARLSTRGSKEKEEALDEDDFEEVHEGDDHQNFLLFLEVQAQKEEAERALEGAALEDLYRQEMERIIYEQTIDFLNKLIDTCVDMAEYTDENVILRKNLDKMKVVIELRAKVAAVEEERKTVQFLNRKCAEFFRRKSAFSKMIADNSPANRKKYYDALKKLDDWLNKEKKFKKVCSARIQECKEEYKVVNEKFGHGVHRLEHLIKSTLHREKFDRLQSVVLEKVEQMSTIRKDISTDRTKLLILQHDAVILRQQLTKLEDVGNGLFIKDYETLETETAGLEKKLEERSSAVQKLYNHMNSNIHNLAHLKERQKMTRHLISVQKQILNELQVEQKEMRKYITELKVRKTRNRRDIRHISFQSGLLDKPVLMRDYDSTEISISKLRISNEDLKKQADDIVKKIAQLEDMNIKKKL